MNFIETIFESFKEGIKEILGEKPERIRVFCIGSGSSFVIHKNITYKKALSIYEKVKYNLPLGKRVEKKENGYTQMEKYHCLEANSGYCYTFIFEIKEIKEYDPNEAIKEWEEYNRKLRDKK